MTEKNTTETAPPPELMPMPQVIADLIAEQGDMSDAKFCREYNFAYSDNVWGRVRRWINADPKSPNYGKHFYPGDMAEVLVACEAMLRRIKERKVLASKIRAGTRFIEFTHFETIFNRIKILLEGETQNRGLMYLAPNGGGKTALCREAIAREGGTIVECRESWRDSYFAAILDTCLKVGAKYDGRPPRNSREAEQALITELNKRKGILAFDEGEYFGKCSLSLIKLILNHTPTIVLITAIPQLWNRVQNAAWIESLAVVRRIDHVEELTLIHPGDVLKFVEMRKVNLNGTSEESCRIIARHANNFGRYDLIGRVLDRLVDESPKEYGEVESACIAVEQMMRAPKGDAR